LIELHGYRGLSLKAIASRAKVTRNVLYNWWNGDISRIVEEALLPNVREWKIPDTGNFRGDIEAFLDLSLDAIHKPNTLKGFLTLAAEIVSDSDELRETTRYFRAPYARLIDIILKRAEARGEIAAGLNSKHIAQIVSGSILQFAISRTLGRRGTKTLLSDTIMKLAAK